MTSPSKKRVRVMLVDDSEVVRMGLRTLLSAESSLEIVAEAGTVSGAVEICSRIKPEVLLLDLRLPDGSGFDACRQVLQRVPDIRVLVLTSVADDSLVDEAIRAGAHGYLLKEINGRGLVQAILDVAAGKSILDPAITARVMQVMKSGGPVKIANVLSTQERRVLALVAEGKTNKEIGLGLDLSEKTVKNYLANIFAKLNISTRTQAALYYTQNSPNP
ncbi:MAG TPA: response regulator transcription factor [Opitutaceae bacterium]|nr:response regulator transcription factor [Opitutaceae bacterium]